MEGGSGLGTRIVTSLHFSCLRLVELVGGSCQLPPEMGQFRGLLTISGRTRTRGAHNAEILERWVAGLLDYIESIDSKGSWIV